MNPDTYRPDDDERFISNMALHDAVSWSVITTLPPFREPQAGALPMPRHSLRIRRVNSGEDGYRGWASTEVVAHLGIPMVLPDTLQVLAPSFGNPTPTGARAPRRYHEWESTGGGLVTSRRRGESRRVAGGAASLRYVYPPRSGRVPYWASPAPAVAAPAPAAAVSAPAVAVLVPPAAEV